MNLDTVWSDKEMLKYIYRLMQRVLIIPGDKKGTYRPVKNTSREDCYEVLYKIQKLLGVHEFKMH